MGYISGYCRLDAENAGINYYLIYIIIRYNFILLKYQPKAPTIAANGGTHKRTNFTGTTDGGRAGGQRIVL